MNGFFFTGSQLEIERRHRMGESALAGRRRLRLVVEQTQCSLFKNTRKVAVLQRRAENFVRRFCKNDTGRFVDMRNAGQPEFDRRNGGDSLRVKGTDRDAERPGFFLAAVVCHRSFGK